MMSTSTVATTAYGVPVAFLAVLALTVVSPGLGSLIALVGAAAMGVGVRKNVDAISATPVTFIGH